MFVKLSLNTITVLTLAVGLISCSETPSVNSDSGIEEKSAVNTSSTATAERPLIVATTSVSIIRNS